MIEYIEGEVRSHWSNGIVVVANGVGYGLEMPVSDLCEIANVAGKASFWIHTHVREDQLKLFGFTKRASRDAFRILLTVNGVGPKAALAILSTIEVDSLRQCIASDDSSILRQAPGVGPKLAERIILELKNKLNRLGVEDGLTNVRPTATTIGGWENIDTDIRSALTNLGFAEKQISSVLKDVRSTGQPGDGFPALMKQALSRLTRVNDREVSP